MYQSRLATTGMLVALALCGGAVTAAQAADMTFFVTSGGKGDGANLGGLEGADAHCQG